MQVTESLEERREPKPLSGTESDLSGIRLSLWFTYAKTTQCYGGPLLILPQLHACLCIRKLPPERSGWGSAWNPSSTEREREDGERNGDNEDNSCD